MFCNKAGASIAAGNAIIIKSSEKSPLSGTYLAKLALEAGIPAGIVQCLNGLGETGKLISEHMRIRKISFTGMQYLGFFVAVLMSLSQAPLALAASLCRLLLNPT